MKLIRSFLFAFNGIKICFISEANFKIHVLFTALVITLAIIFNVTAIQWALLLFCIALVITMEMINTGIEKLCNFFHPEFHPSIKKVKDIAAGAVFISAVCSATVGAIILFPAIFNYFKNM